MAYTFPTISDFKNMFRRDFPYGLELSSVQDADIAQAIEDAGFAFNQGLFTDQSTFSRAYLLLSAHFLVVNLRNSSQGIAGQYSWLTQSKSVGSVSESMAIPQRVLDNPSLAQYSKTTYGMQFINFVLPRLTGAISSVCGRTHA